MAAKEIIHSQTDNIRRQIIKDTGSFPGTCEYSKQLAQSLGGGCIFWKLHQNMV